MKFPFLECVLSLIGQKIDIVMQVNYGYSFVSLNWRVSKVIMY